MSDWTNFELDKLADLVASENHRVAQDCGEAPCMWCYVEGTLRDLSRKVGELIVETNRLKGESQPAPSKEIGDVAI